MRILLMIMLLCPGVLAWYVIGKTQIGNVKEMFMAGIKCIVYDILIFGIMYLLNILQYGVNKFSLSIGSNEGKYNIFNADFVKKYLLEAALIAIIFGLLVKYVFKWIMKKSKKTVLSTILVVFICFLTGCSFDRNQPVINTVDSGNANFTITRLDCETEFEDNASIIEFDENNQDYCISSGGEYIVSGNLKGQLVIDTSDEIVHLLFDGATIKANQGPAVYIKSAGKVIITLAEGTENTLEDANNYRGFEDTKACLFADCPLTINGKGTLYVYAFCDDGIKSTEQIKVIDSVLKLKAKGCGIKSSEGVVLMPSVLSVECESTGIKSSKDEESFVYIGAGDVSIIAGKYGINTSGIYKYENCTCNITGVLGNVQANIIAGGGN